MIYGTIGTEYKYDVNDPKFKTAFEFLNRKDLASLPEGRIDLEHGVYANIQHYVTSPEESLPFETHDLAFDIHYMAEGEEYIGVYSREHLSVSVPHDDEKEWTLYHEPGFPGRVFLHTGEFIVIEPECAHKPRCSAGECKAVKKIVMKVPV